MIEWHLGLFQKNADGTISKEEPTVNRGGRVTNQLEYLKKLMRILWRHHYAWPFHKPVDPVALNLPVRGPVLGSEMWPGLCLCVLCKVCSFDHNDCCLIMFGCALAHINGNSFIVSTSKSLSPCYCDDVTIMSHQSTCTMCVCGSRLELQMHTLVIPGGHIVLSMCV